MDNIDLLYDHYKDTYALSKQSQGHRNKLFVYLCVLEALSFLFLIRPDTALEVFAAGINAHFDTGLVFGNVILQTLLWILIAYVTVRYCQETLYVERLYPYLDNLEKAIMQESKTKIFEREGEAYQRDYPMVLNFIDLFYKMFCPVLFVGINIVRISMEWKGKSITPALICDTAIFSVIFIVTWFYFFEIHSKITAWCKKYIPCVNKMAIVLRKILKEV